MSLISQLRRRGKNLARDLSPPPPITGPGSRTTGFISGQDPVGSSRTSEFRSGFDPIAQSTFAGGAGLSSRLAGTPSPRTPAGGLGQATGGTGGRGFGQAGGGATGLSDRFAGTASPRTRPFELTPQSGPTARGGAGGLGIRSREGITFRRDGEFKPAAIPESRALFDREGNITAFGESQRGAIRESLSRGKEALESRGLFGQRGRRPITDLAPTEEREGFAQLQAGVAASPAGVPTVGPGGGPSNVIPGLSGAAPGFELGGVGAEGLQPFGIGEQLAATFDPLQQLAREQLSAAEERFAIQQPEIEKQLESEKDLIRGDIAKKFAPQFERLGREEERQVETARRTGAAAGSARGTRAAEFEVGLRDNANQRVEALDAQRRLEERAAIMSAEGASAEAMTGIQSAVNNARLKVAELSQESALLEQGLNQELIKQAESGRQFDMNFQLKAQDALTNAFKAETGRKKVDSTTQIQLGELATKIPEGQQVQLGEFTITGLKAPTKNLQVFQVTDSAGNFKLITIDKSSGETAVQDLGNVEGLPVPVAGGGGGGFGGGFGGGGSGFSGGGGGTGGSDSSGFDFGFLGAGIAPESTAIGFAPAGSGFSPSAGATRATKEQLEQQERFAPNSFLASLPSVGN